MVGYGKGWVFVRVRGWFVFGCGTLAPGYVLACCSLIYRGLRIGILRNSKEWVFAIIQAPMYAELGTAFMSSSYLQMLSLELKQRRLLSRWLAHHQGVWLGKKAKTKQAPMSL